MKKLLLLSLIITIPLLVGCSSSNKEDTSGIIDSESKIEELNNTLESQNFDDFEELEIGELEN